MIGYVTMGMSLVPMVGPVIGGALDEAFGWQANFVLLGLGGLGLLALVWADQGETADGAAASSFADAGRGNTPSLLRSQRFWGYCLAAAFASGAFFAYLGGAPYVGSEVFGLDPATLGFYFGAPAVGYMAGNFLSGRFSVRVGMNRMVLTGALVTTTGLAVLALLTMAGLIVARGLLRAGDDRGPGQRHPAAKRQCRDAVGPPAACGVGGGPGRGHHHRRRRGAFGAGRGGPVGPGRGRCR